MSYIDAVKWSEAQEAIRQRMREQPRGYQAALARTLGKTPGFVNQIVRGDVPIPVDHLDAVLDSLGMEYDVVLKGKDAE